ncbi:hypothetical protein ABT369_43455 [Dactylosporangium sp. NPDC000244]|uniref:hypothetical protein n=1 Tax=Dactylosporangium sp. NPDC000244 TaxID=3154365 RepID=UPI003321FA7E
MAASDEHTAISEIFVGIVERLSNSRLYGFRESDRSMYDFACNLTQTHERIVVGQTLWGHHEGVLKDIVSLQANAGHTTLGIYLFPDTLRARRAIDEALQHIRRIRTGPAVLLRMIPVPSDFRADNIEDHAHMVRYLEGRISDDLLLRNVFGNANADDLVRFQRFANIPGMNLAILEAIHEGTAPLVSNLASTLGAARTTTANKFDILVASGFIELNEDRPVGLSPKGRLVRDIASLLRAALADPRVLNAELNLLLARVGISVPSEVPDLRDPKGLTPYYTRSDSHARCIQLLAEAVNASDQYGSPLTLPHYDKI